jgi:hypothetical protein
MTNTSFPSDSTVEGEMRRAGQTMGVTEDDIDLRQR